MHNDWLEVKLSDISTRIGDGLHGTPKYADDGDYYFINGNNLVNGKVVYKEGTKRVNLEQYELHKKELTEKTLLVSINGTIGNVAEYNGEEVVLGKSACYINLKDKISKDFVRYVLSGRLFQEYIERCSTGTTIKNVSLKLMRDFLFNIPRSETEQQNLASILKDLDGEIELNRQTNQTLEKMAQALFKSWFVDFGPVIDNALAAGTNISDFPEPLQKRAELRKTVRQSADTKKLPEGLSQEIRKLFPSEFEESELGWVPKGWKIKALDEIAYYQNGLALQKFRPENEDDYLPVVKIAQLRQGYADGKLIVDKDDIDVVLKVLNNDRLKSLINNENFDVDVKHPF